MSSNKNRIVKNYLSEIKHLLPLVRKPEKRFLADIRQSIYDYCETADTISFDTLVSVFGEPKDLVSNYISEKDAVILRKELRFSRHIKYTLYIILSIVILLAGLRTYTIYLDYINAKKAQIDHAVIVIEEEP